ncbi:MAG: integrase core domain-containing protein [Candidatus Jordarchaeum sp.]|uniref:integrase core domain-containing protein n=1 Tax=Candidatus Jordarchaeum sp. TaxID=2823881 RepID=UPI00404A6F38
MGKFRTTVCGYQFTESLNFTEMRVESQIISTTLDLYFEGFSVREIKTQICKIFRVNVSQVTIWNWIKKYSELAYNFEKLHGTLKNRTKFTKGLKESDAVSVLLKGWSFHYNCVRCHQNLNGNTPVQASGIETETNWHKLIKEAINNRVQNQLAYESFEDGGKANQTITEPITVMVRT